MRLSILFFLLPAICLAQSPIDAEQFFVLGLSSLEGGEKPVDEQIRFPWIDRYELRTETNDFDVDKQEYTLRLSPSTARIRKAQKALYDELKNAPDLKGQEIYCDLLLRLHIDWLSLFMLNENRNILDERGMLLQDRQTLYERMAGTYEFDPEKLVKLQTEKSDFEVDSNKLALEWDYLVNKYGLQNREIDFSDFITVENLSTYLTSTILLGRNEASSEDLETEHKRQLLLKEMELEKAEEKRMIDFFQLRYNGPHTDVLQEKLSIGLGFQLSNSGNKKLKLQELQIEQEELNRKSARDMQERQEKLAVLASKLQNDLQAFFYFQKIMKQELEELQKLSGKLSPDEGTSLLLLLDIEERHLAMQMKSLDKKEDLLKAYLKYLHESEKMCQSDFVNYLN